MVEVTDKQLRDAGFSAKARELPRDETALRLLCAFNGVELKDAPPGWHFHPNAATKAAWERVATEARKCLTVRQWHELTLEELEQLEPRDADWCESELQSRSCVRGERVHLTRRLRNVPGDFLGCVITQTFEGSVFDGEPPSHVVAFEATRWAPPKEPVGLARWEEMYRGMVANVPDFSGSQHRVTAWVVNRKNVKPARVLVRHGLVCKQ